MEHPVDEVRAVSHHAPIPGEPASQGPRPPAGPKDLGWASLGTGLALVTAAQFVALAHTLLGRTFAPTTSGLVLGFLITVVWLLTISWLVLGCWRRTIWGCPFDHLSHTGHARRCQRHDLVDGG